MVSLSKLYKNVTEIFKFQSINLKTLQINHNKLTSIFSMVITGKQLVWGFIVAVKNDINSLELLSTLDNGFSETVGIISKTFSCFWFS